jgi:hypothetical protein
MVKRTGGRIMRGGEERRFRDMKRPCGNTPFIGLAVDVRF